MIFRPPLNEFAILRCYNLQSSDHLLGHGAARAAINLLARVLQQARQNGQKDAEVVVVGQGEAVVCLFGNDFPVLLELSEFELHPFFHQQPACLNGHLRESYSPMGEAKE